MNDRFHAIDVQGCENGALERYGVEMIGASFEAIQRGGLAVIGEAATADAISRGQVHVLFLDPNVGTEETRAELTRSAIATGADVEVVEEDERLREVEGIAATLEAQVQAAVERYGAVKRGVLASYDAPVDADTASVRMLAIP